MNKGLCTCKTKYYNAFTISKGVYMSTISNTFRLPTEISEALRQLAVPPYSKAYLVTEALKAYKPLKKILQSDAPIHTSKSVIGIPATVSSRFTKPEYGELVETFWQSGQFANYEEAKDKATEFINHYDSNGWKVGKNAMKNWKATVSQWLARRKKDGQANGNKPGDKYPAKQSLAKRSADSSGRMDTYIESLRQNEQAVGSTGTLISPQMDI